MRDRSLGFPQLGVQQDLAEKVVERGMRINLSSFEKSL